MSDSKSKIGSQSDSGGEQIDKMPSYESVKSSNDENMNLQ